VRHGRDDAPILGIVSPPVADPPGPPVGPPPQIRAAGALVALEGALGLVFAVALLVRTGSTEFRVADVLGEAAYFGVIGAAVLGVGGGLLAGRRWARTPAIVTQLLLLPAVYSLLGPSRQLLLGILAGAVVLTAFLLLISERAKVWSMGLELPDAPR
jgi:hypothetical protein